LNTIFVCRDGRTEQVTRIDRTWLGASAGAFLWVDLEAPSIPESLLLRDTFAFHRLAVEDAMSAGQTPKVEAYDGYLFAVVGGKDEEVDCFVGQTFLVTVHWSESKAIAELADNARHNAQWMSEGSVGLFHRVADAVIDGFRPRLEELRGRVDRVEAALFDKPSPALVRDLLSIRGETFALGTICRAQRDAVDRMARREFVDISTEMAWRFRDVDDHLVRMADEVSALQDRLAGLLIAASGLVAAGRRWL
jgi:magnesium transporter